MLLIGRVARAHGNRGQVIVNPDTDFPDERFQPGRVVHVRQHDRVEPRRLGDVRFHQGRPVIALEGIETMNDAEALAGAELLMPEDALPPLPEGTFYHHDLVGCEVRDTKGRPVGRITGVEGSLERSRLVVEGRSGEVLIPLVADICVRVDPGARMVIVDPPEGLLELNERASSE
jgi:16S rRNA processing protein RimM